MVILIILFMARYLIGDIHGCGTEFAQLLEQLNFDPVKDQLYLAGDLIGRGNQPVQVFELAQQYNAKLVLGNYDLHFLATYVGSREPVALDCFEKLYELPPAQLKEHVKWLLNQGSLFINDKYFALCHASLPHNWSYEQANFLGTLAMNYLRDAFQKGQPDQVFTTKFKDTLALDYSNSREKRLVVEALLAFTVGRMCQIYRPDQKTGLCPDQASSFDFVKAGYLAAPEYSMLLLHDEPLPLSAYCVDLTQEHSFIDFGNKGKPYFDLEEGKFPWYDLQGFLKQLETVNPEQAKQLRANPNFYQAPRHKPIYFGHWSRLNGETLPAGYICSDTSCVYGDRLTAYLLPESDNLTQAELLQLAQPIASVSRMH